MKKKYNIPACQAALDRYMVQNDFDILTPEQAIDVLDRLKLMPKSGGRAKILRQHLRDGYFNAIILNGKNWFIYHSKQPLLGLIMAA